MIKTIRKKCEYEPVKNGELRKFIANLRTERGDYTLKVNEWLKYLVRNDILVRLIKMTDLRTVFYFIPDQPIPPGFLLEGKESNPCVFTNQQVTHNFST